MVLAAGGALLLCLVVGGGCRTRVPGVAGTNIGTGDVLYGRLPAQRPSESFTFEGVESSMLDFDLLSDDASLAAPEVSLLDPEGKPVDLASHFASAEGAASVKVRGVVLLRTGTYQVTVTPSPSGQPVYYRFSRRLSFPPMDQVPVTLTSASTFPVFVSAPRGGRVNVTVTPQHGSSVVPMFKGVEDPWGGRALDPTRVPAGASPPEVTTGPDGTLYLSFSAPIPGRYKVLASARPGQDGAVLISTLVSAPGGPVRPVWHPNRPAESFGVPVAGSASDG